MPRYVVQRTFPDGLTIPLNGDGAKTCVAVADRNAQVGATWVHSYVTPDKRTTFCIYDAPTPEAVRNAASLNGLPVDHISEVQVLDPYFYN